MRIVSLAPFLSETIAHFGLIESLVGVSHLCDYPKGLNDIPKLTSKAGGKILGEKSLQTVLTPHKLQLSTLRIIAPDFLVTSPTELSFSNAELQQMVREQISEHTKLLSYAPKTFEQILEMFKSVADKLGVIAKGLNLVGRVKAQSMDWAQSFYERTRGKRVCVLNSIEPLTIAGLWVPEMIHLTSAISQHRVSGEESKEVSWSEIQKFSPDVIIIAPDGIDLKSCMQFISTFEALPGWQDLPAVKRGEVIFCEGNGLFNRAGPRILDTMGVLVSAIAGLESGYITPRDSFQRLRWVELNRHRLSA